MHSAKLLVVLDAFLIEGRGLIVTPDFSVLTGGWNHHAEEVTVVTAAGESFCATAHFEPYISTFRILKFRWTNVGG